MDKDAVKPAGARRPGRPRTASESDARERLLDEAERLFAEHGFYGVSVRDVTRAAGVDVALAHYHFGAKRGLFDAVFLRRAEILNADRLLALEAARASAAPGEPTVANIIEAFIGPVLARWACGDPGWKSYCALVAQVNNTPSWGGKTMTRYFDPVVQRFIEALRRALPDLAEADLFWSYHFLSGALTLTLADTGRIDLLSAGVARSSDHAAVMACMPRFFAAGFQALARKA
jgi:AcrR family transcriptional regulator